MGAVWIRSFEAFSLSEHYSLFIFPLTTFYPVLILFFRPFFFKQFHNDYILHTIYFQIVPNISHNPLTMTLLVLYK